MNKRFKERNERNMKSKRRNVDNSIAARVEQAYIVNQNRWLQANSNHLLNATENTDGGYKENLNAFSVSGNVSKTHKNRQLRQKVTSRLRD